ncbi:hypothetical protein C1H46_041203 [Malus baccata]|uniref:Uncharacterized protein n=1 Tax=Malus baccata TaxID=106549 RepID=A0A540KGX9_MALBA|nr:hypothetical protein C1H46_041203 [Malus baccata]
MQNSTHSPSPPPPTPSPFLSSTPTAAAAATIPILSIKDPKALLSIILVSSLFALLLFLSSSSSSSLSSSAARNHSLEPKGFIGSACISRDEDKAKRKQPSGSSFTILSRNFIEFCVVGIDNLPRTLLMYFSNTPSALSNYFPTILCNSQQFNKTIINHNLVYANSETPPREKPQPISSADYDAMIQHGAAFVTGLRVDDPILDRVDREILKRRRGKVVPGGWCLGGFANDTCSVWGDADILRPSPQARRLEQLLVGLLSNGTFLSHQCIYE